MWHEGVVGYRLGEAEDIGVYTKLRCGYCVVSGV